MPLLMLREIPRYECLLEASKEFPDLNVSATESCLHLLRAADSVFRVLSGHLHDHGFSQGGFTVMSLLWDTTESSTPAELAQKANVTRASMTGLLDTLEKEGFVTRAPCPNDRRMMRVTLTRKGRRQLEKVLPEHFRHMAGLLKPLSAAERKTFVELLLKVAAQADEMNPPDREACISSK